MKKTYLLGGGIAVLTAAMLVGCNGNDDDGVTATPAPATTQLTVTPSLGKILNAKVIARNAATGKELGSGMTDPTTGIAKFTAEKTTSPVVIEVQGSNTAMYFDEASNANVPLPATQKIRAIAPSLGDTPNFGVTVLTDLAYQAAVKAAGTETKVNTADIVNQANNQIKALLAKELGTSSLLTPPTIIGKDTIVKNVVTAKNTANDYALKLAALANLGSGENGARALDVLAKLGEDISDGSLDGKKGTAGVAYSHDTSSFTVALDKYLANYVNQQQLNGIYTSSVLNGFVLNQGELKITVTTGSTGGGTGTNGTVCVATATSNLVVNGFPVSQTNKYCYINFPANTVCDSSNSVLNGFVSNINFSQAGVSGNVSMAFSPAASCPADTIVKYDYATGQVVVAAQ